MADDKLRILGIPGSLRRGSFNRGLIRAAVGVAPEGVLVESCDLSAIPLFDADVEAAGDPEPVRDLKARIRPADALLIATPEYNYSVPGVLKNAIDWASRPMQDGPLFHMPIGLLGASPGPMGTVRAQLALRQVFVYTESYVLPKPELFVPRARDLFDAEGNLQDEATRSRVRELLLALAAWTRLVRPEHPGGVPASGGV